ncbi:MAG: response regulator transcription factor [Mariprofundales bacterium]
MTHNILIIEDEIAIARMMQLHLQAAGFNVTLCYNGNDAVQLFLEQQQQQNTEWAWDLCILDRLLPGYHGMQLLERLQQVTMAQSMPILMVTALGSTAQLVEGLNAGADDYLAKPFEPEELIARVQALLRRTHRLQTDKTIAERYCLGDICLDLESGQVWVNKQEVELRPLEVRLLETLIQRKGKVCSRTYLLDNVWGSQAFVEPRTVDVCVKRVRQALAKHTVTNYIETVRTRGYRFIIPDD